MMEDLWAADLSSSTPKQRTPVAVESPFPFNHSLHLIKIAGDDSTAFLNSLTTQNTLTHKNDQSNNFRSHAILDGKGKVLFLFLLNQNKKGEWFLLTADSQVQKYLEDRVFIEQVTLTPIDINQFKLDTSLKEFLASLLSFDNLIDYQTNLIEKGYFFLIPKVINFLLEEKTSILEFNLLDWISSNKGCFPGQEITTRFIRQGKNYFQKFVLILINSDIDLKNQFELGPLPHSIKITPVETSPNTNPITTVGNLYFFGYFKSIDRYFFLAKLTKDFNAENNDFSFFVKKTMIKGVVKYKLHQDEKLESLHQLGLNYYHKSDYETAKKHFEDVLKINPYYTNSLEALAMVEEKMGNIVEAIKFNQQFSQSDPTAVMAHTNLSRLYMLQGFIEKAEEEKKQATILMFRNAAKEKTNANKTELDKLEKENELKKLEERKKRLLIFEQVLELDPLDETANFGKGKILFEDNQYDAAIQCLKKVIEINENYSTAYLFLNKSLLAQLLPVKPILEKEAKNKSKKLTELNFYLEKGINISKENGDLMPLREMEEIKKKSLAIKI